MRTELPEDLTLEDIRWRHAQVRIMVPFELSRFSSAAGQEEAFVAIDLARLNAGETVRYPREIAAELGASLGQVSYHVRTLARYGLVKLVETRPKRGALEHYYRAEDRPVITSEAWERVPSIVKQATVRAALEQLSERSGRTDGASADRPHGRSSSRVAPSC